MHNAESAGITKMGSSRVDGATTSADSRFIPAAAVVLENGPQINVSVETIESIYSTYSKWRTARTYPPLTAAEKADYYKSYDPMIGVKIAGTLSILFAMAVLYVLYKSKCKRMKFIRNSTSTEEAIDGHQMQSSSCSLHHQPPSPWATENSLVHQSVSTVLVEEGGKLANSCESGRETPLSTATTPQSVTTAKPHYYTDDREMPEWKRYAKELFLYGGPGLWRSASLKGSDPVLLMAQSSFDETMNGRSHLRTGSLSGSMMGNLSMRRDGRKLSVLACTNSAYSSQCRLQVPARVQPQPPRHCEFHPDDKFIRMVSPAPEHSRYHQSEDNNCKKAFAQRSVSFRESDMTNYHRTGSKRVRTRPGSLRTPRTTDYNRLTGGPSSGNVDSHGQASYRRSSFRAPSRQSSIRAGARASTATCGMHTISGEGMTSPPLHPPSSPNSRTVIVHRIPIHMQQDRTDAKATYSRSTSLTTEPTRGWRSTIAKLIRAKSTSGHSVRTNGEANSPCNSGRKSNSKSSGDSNHHEQSSAHPSPTDKSSPVEDDSYDAHIDICVIQATPAASPCASIRSTLSGDSLEMTGLAGKGSPSPPSISVNLSVGDRRKRFARMKGQTIDHEHDHIPLGDGSNLLAPPPPDYCGSLHPVVDLRCRSTSPVRLYHHPASSSLSSSLLQVLHHPSESAGLVPLKNRSLSGGAVDQHALSIASIDHLPRSHHPYSSSTHSTSHI